METMGIKALEEADRLVKLAIARRETQLATSIRLVIQIITTNSLNTVPQLSFLLNVGDGSQTIKWLSLAVSNRLRQLTSHKRGTIRTRDNHELAGFYLVASVNTAKTAKLVPSEMYAQTLWPTDRITEHFRDGDEVFVAITTKPKWDDACCIDFTVWQDSAYHQSSPAALRRIREFQLRRANGAALVSRMEKWRSAAWDAGVALRLQAVLGSAPSLPAPPPPSVFGLPSSNSKPQQAVPMLADALLESDEPVESKDDLEGGSVTGLPWLGTGNIAGLFEKDWSKMQTPALMPTTKERDALRAALFRAYAPLRDVFRFYSNVMNAAVAIRSTLSLSHRLGTESSAIESSFKMSRIELELLLRDCRALNTVTSPFINPSHITTLVVTGEVKRQAAAHLLVGATSDPLGAKTPAARKEVAILQSPVPPALSTRFVGAATSPSERRAIMSIRPRPALPDPDKEAFAPNPIPVGASPLSAAGKSLLSPKGPKTTSSFKPSRASISDSKAAAAVALAVSNEEMDRPAFFDAVVLVAGGFWEITKGDLSYLTAKHTTTPASQAAPAESSKPPAAMASFASLAAGKVPPVRAHMVSHFLTNFIVPRSKKVQGTGIRKELANRKVASIFVRELGLLRFAYNKYCTIGVGDDLTMDITGWRRMLLDCGLYHRMKPAATEAGDERASPAILDAPTMSGGGTVGFDNMKGKRLADRDLVMIFLLSQSEDEAAPAASDVEVDTLASAVSAGPRVLAATAAASSSGSLSELSFSEWIEGLYRLALAKWDDPAMELHEKVARVVDAIAVRMITDPGSGWKPDMADAARAAQYGTKRM